MAGGGNGGGGGFESLATILRSPFFKEIPENNPRNVSPFSGINFSENKEDNHDSHD